MERPDLTRIPLTPGVYRFLAGDGRVLYVGKARRLRQRLSDYFSSNDLHPRTRAMLEEAVDLTWLTCASEPEALLVEAGLIRELQPPYNVRLREDRDAYPYVALSRHDIPRLMVWHGRTGDVERFGPFPSPGHARELRDVIERVWQLRPCSDAKLAQHTKLARPCLLGDVGRCCAPCVDPSGYPERVDAARRLLDGHVTDTVEVLEQGMQHAAAERAFEHAATLRDRAEAVRVLTRRGVATDVPGDVDVLGVASDAVGAASQLLRLRDGSLRGCPTAVLDPALHESSVRASIDAFDRDADHAAPDQADGLVDLALANAYADAAPARLVLVPALPSVDTRALLASLTPHVKLRTPRTASERALVTMAEENAAVALEHARLKRASDHATRRAELAALADALELAEPPLRIECLDISHFQGTGTVSCVVVLEEGVVRPALARRFRLKDRADDPASIHEVVTRRLSHLVTDPTAATARDEDWSLRVRPGLLLIDGGPAQVDAAHTAARELGVDVPIASLSKRLEEIWLPNRPSPLRLPLDSPALYLLQRARDEAHRTSIRYQRRLRPMDRDVLDGIAGLGKARRTRLLEEAGSPGELASWTRARFEQCSWLPRPVADAVFAALHPEPTAPAASPTPAGSNHG